MGKSRRDADRLPRPRKLDAERLHLINYLRAQGRTLREIAAEVGVSHETVRTMLRASLSVETPSFIPACGVRSWTAARAGHA